METTSFYAMLSRMKYINRWGLMRNTRPENISEHSLDTAIIAHALALIGNRVFDRRYDPDRAAVLAIFHDAAEILTGDLPTPIKYHSPEIRDAYKDVEALAVERLVALLPDTLMADYRAALSAAAPEDADLLPLVKAADKITAIIKCIEEEKSGNREFHTAAQTLRKSVLDMALPEADYFMAMALPAYGLTLDELETPPKKG